MDTLKCAIVLAKLDRFDQQNRNVRQVMSLTMHLNLSEADQERIAITAG